MQGIGGDIVRGVVMDIKDGRAVVFKKNGDIAEVRDCGYRIGQTINIGNYPSRKLIAMAACFAMVFVTGISGYAVAYRVPYGYIYVDVNPSMRLDLNCFDRVISVTPLNDEAEELMEKYPIQKSDTEQCINEIAYACREKKYLNDDNNSIEFNVVTKKQKLNSRMQEISEKLKNNDLSISVHNVDKEENDKAMKYRTSPKRLSAVEAYTKVFGGTLEDNFAKLKGVTNKEIYENINSETDSRGKYKSSPERLEAVKKYTDIFGGSLEENMRFLKGVSTQKIRDAAESRTPIETDGE